MFVFDPTQLTKKAVWSTYDVYLTIVKFICEITFGLDCEWDIPTVKKNEGNPPKLLYSVSEIPVLYWTTERVNYGSSPLLLQGELDIQSVANSSI